MVEPTKIGFGKHEGKEFKDIPLGYLKWMVKEKTAQANQASSEIAWRKVKKPRKSTYVGLAGYRE